MSLEALQSFFSEENNQSIDNYNKYKREPDNLILTRHIERDKKANQLYFKMSKNIIKSEKLRIEITKSIKENKPIDDLFLIAIECISLMTGDELFYKQNIENLKGRA